MTTRDKLLRSSSFMGRLKKWTRTYHGNYCRRDEKGFTTKNSNDDDISSLTITSVKLILEKWIVSFFIALLQILQPINNKRYHWIEMMNSVCN